MKQTNRRTVTFLTIYIQQCQWQWQRQLWLTDTLIKNARSQIFPSFIKCRRWRQQYERSFTPGSPEWQMAPLIGSCSGFSLVKIDLMTGILDSNWLRLWQFWPLIGCQEMVIITDDNPGWIFCRKSGWRKQSIASNMHHQFNTPKYIHFNS